MTVASELVFFRTRLSLPVSLFQVFQFKENILDAFFYITNMPNRKLSEEETISNNELADQMFYWWIVHLLFHVVMDNVGKLFDYFIPENPNAFLSIDNNPQHKTKLYPCGLSLSFNTHIEKEIGSVKQLFYLNLSKCLWSVGVRMDHE